MPAGSGRGGSRAANSKLCLIRLVCCACLRVASAQTAADGAIRGAVIDAPHRSATSLRLANHRSRLHRTWRHKHGFHSSRSGSIGGAVLRDRLFYFYAYDLLHLQLVAPVAEARRRTAQKMDLAIHLAQPQRPAIARHLTAVNLASTRHEKWTVNENAS